LRVAPVSHRAKLREIVCVQLLRCSNAAYGFTLIRLRNTGAIMTVIELDARGGAIPLSEPIPITDIFATGVDIDEQPEYTRLIYWAEHPMLYGAEGGLRPIERLVVAKIIMPRATWDRIAAEFCAKRARRGHN
jgi:hypothetical protein